jgi:multiple sugar transport system permease protein
MLLVHFLPMAGGLYMSLLRLNARHLLEFLGAPYVGLDNYRFVLLDPTSPVRADFLGALRNTLIYTLGVNGAALVIGFAAALLLAREFRGRGLVRTVLLLPWIVPTYVVGILFYFIWQPDNGIVNHVLHDDLHLPVRPFWLVGPLTLFAIVLPTVWRNFPYATLMLSAGLAGIPRDLYDAADVDGASEWQKLRHITLPLLRPVVAVVVLFGIIGTLYGFNIVYAMFGSGVGYPGEWGDVLVTMIYRSTFNGLNFGAGAAASVVLMLACLAMIGVWYRLLWREEPA